MLQILWKGVYCIESKFKLIQALKQNWRGYILVGCERITEIDKKNYKPTSAFIQRSVCLSDREESYKDFIHLFWYGDSDDDYEMYWFSKKTLSLL